MLDINFILEQGDLARKSNLLKNIKLTLESLIFDRSNSNTSYSSLWHNFNGNINRFCRCIVEILYDGLILENFSYFQPLNSEPSSNFSNQILSSPLFKLSTSGSTNNTPSLEENINNQFIYPTSKTPWAFILFIFSDELINTNNQELNVGLVEFKNVLEQIIDSKRCFSAEDTDLKSLDLTQEWIFYSLRQRKPYCQLKSLIENRSILEKYYNEKSFILDSSYFSDFLIYIRGFETENYSILNQVKGVLVEKSQRKQSSNRSSRLDLTESSPINTLSINTQQIKQHRRIHSFPNIQINLLKKNSVNSEKDELNTNSTPKETNSNLILI